MPPVSDILGELVTPCTENIPEAVNTCRRAGVTGLCVRPRVADTCLQRPVCEAGGCGAEEHRDPSCPQGNDYNSIGTSGSSRES